MIVRVLTFKITSPKPPQLSLVAVRYESLKMFLQMREVNVLNFAFSSVVLGRVALDVFVHAFIA